jgi:trehalose 6-phosphate phosphatase
MKHLSAHWDNLKKHIADKYLMLFLDYDGTLTAIVESPDKALIPRRTRDLLKKLSANRRCTIAVVTGRAAKDIKGKIGISNIIYAGNHGLEIQGPDIKFKTPLPAGYKTSLKKIKSQLQKKLSLIKGILLEDKGLSLSFHYRLVGRKQVPLVKNIFQQIVRPFIACDKVKIKTGKKVFEIRPPIEWDKGKAALWLLNTLTAAPRGEPIMPIYIGDDATDEDAFRMLKNKGITIFVGGPKRSYARYYLKNTKEVFEFLKRISRIFQGRKFYYRGERGENKIIR